MHAIEPDMVLGKLATDGQGLNLGEIVDVGLYSHSRVKFLVVADAAGGHGGTRIPVRTVGVDEIDRVGADTVTLRIKA